MAKIFIDPGHGGKDPGAVGSSSREAQNVLAIALEMKAQLEKYGHQVKLSRSSDKFLELGERASLANAWGADIFVSLHDNSAVDKTATGFETFVMKGSSSTSKSVKLQKNIHKAILKEIALRDRGMKSANFAVLRLTKMPAVLIEYGFISNPTKDEPIIKKYKKLATLTVKGINDYYNIETVENVTGDDDVMKFTNDSTKVAIKDEITQWTGKGVIDKSWLDKFNKGTMTYGDYLGLKLIVQQRSK